MTLYVKIDKKITRSFYNPENTRFLVVLEPMCWPSLWDPSFRSGSPKGLEFCAVFYISVLQIKNPSIIGENIAKR